MDDTLAVEDDEELEEEADAEVDKVLFDLTNGKLGQAGTVQTELPVRVLCSLRSRPGQLTVPSRRRTSSKTRRQKESWSSTDSNSAGSSADPARPRHTWLPSVYYFFGTECTVLSIHANYSRKSFHPTARPED